MYVCTSYVYIITSSIRNCPLQAGVMAAPGSGEGPRRLFSEGMETTVTWCTELTSMRAY